MVFSKIADELQSLEYLKSKISLFKNPQIKRMPDYMWIFYQKEESQWEWGSQGIGVHVKMKGEEDFIALDEFRNGLTPLDAIRWVGQGLYSSCKSHEFKEYMDSGRTYCKNEEQLDGITNEANIAPRYIHIDGLYQMMTRGLKSGNFL